MKSGKCRGIIPALHACYDRVEEVSEDGMRALTRYLVDQEVKGVYVGGSSGECIHRSVEDGKRTLEAVMDEAVGCFIVIAHVACNNAGDSRILMVHTQDLGADGIATIPPTHFKLPEYSAAGYRGDVSEAAPETDFIIYNIPQPAGTALTMNFLETMPSNSWVAGVKNSSTSVKDIQMFRVEAMKTWQDFIVFNGPDGQLVSGLAMGADGGIGGTYGAMPELFLKIYELVSENRIAEARAIQYEADEIIYELRSETCNMYAMIKEVPRISGGIDIGGVRKPLTGLCGNDRTIAGEAAVTIEDAKERYC